MANRPLIVGDVKDKRQHRWEALTFMGMLATFLQQKRWAARGIRNMPSLKFAGLPLKFKTPEARTPAVKASKKIKRQARQRLINKRGWA
jgi:hypothetical protein